jgi:hypothetical protein
MKEAATITFQQPDNIEAGLVIVRYDEERIGLCISLESDGDLEVFMRKADGRRLLDALKEAVG